MCIYKRCCCCCSVLVGAKIIAIISFIFGFINLLTDIIIVAGLNGSAIPAFFSKLYFRIAFDAVMNQAFELIGSPIGTMSIFIIFTLFWLACDGLMLYGITKRKPGFLIPWLVVKLILYIVSMILISNWYFYFL